ncbi:MAG TPA: lysylphosphatidylglycerol synthase transmembrane domain-containing protein, partial [Polyangiales bacterium]
APAKSKGKGRNTRLVLLQVVLTVVAFAYLFHKSDLHALGEAFNRAPIWSVPCAVLALLGVMFAGTLRWQLLLSAYGAEERLPLGYLFRLQLIGLFYNMMPGAVGGDVLRGIVSRRAFGAQGMSAGLTVVLVERVFGLIALMLLVVAVLSFHPIHSLQLSPWVFAIGLAGSVATLAAIALGRRLAPRLPSVLAKRAANLPGLVNVGAFALALGMSLLNQTLVGIMGHITIAPLAPQVSWLDSLVLSPLAFAAIFFPLTVAGAGSRDAAMAALYGLLEVPRETALSASLEVLIAYVVVAAIGGGLSLLTPLQAADADPV